MIDTVSVMIEAFNFIKYGTLEGEAHSTDFDARQRRKNPFGVSGTHHLATYPLAGCCHEILREL